MRPYSGTATANGSGAWSFTTATLADGSHSFTAKATDTAGNVSGLFCGQGCHGRYGGSDGTGDHVVLER